ncbi:MAG TPA: DUF3293 domain-containing protein [Acetobacteraceae bacterium]|jgi:hypothetical protein
MAVSPRLLLAYRRSRYTVGDVDVRIGRACPAMDGFLARHNARSAVFVTAWNPRSRRMPEGWNARMQRRLAKRLRRVAYVSADGSGRGWHEEHVLVFRPLPWVTGLAALFRQHAVVAVRRGRPARLVILPRHAGVAASEDTVPQ